MKGTKVDLRRKAVHRSRRNDREVLEGIARLDAQTLADLELCHTLTDCHKVQRANAFTLPRKGRTYSTLGAIDHTGLTGTRSTALRSYR
jgi:hypothetical protein